MGVPISGYERPVRDVRVEASTRPDGDELHHQRVARWATAACLAGAAGLTVILLATVQGAPVPATDVGRAPVGADANPTVPNPGVIGSITPAGDAPPAVEPPPLVPATGRSQLKASANP
ncbi:MAG: hypothetical protein NVS3B12_23330 [Acidimicrobiales bacterium]